MRCKHPECDAPAGYKNGANPELAGYCAYHSPIAKPCVIDGCANRIAAWNKSGCCKEHAHLRHKFKI